MAVEGAGALARRHHVVRVAEVLRADERADARTQSRREPFALLGVLELELVDARSRADRFTLALESGIASSSVDLPEHDVHACR